jgi:hypothetical protein
MGAIGSGQRSNVTTAVAVGTVRGRAANLSVQRINVMRIGYAVMGVGIAVRNWPLLFNRDEPWPLYEGVTKYLLVGMGLLALLGLRYPVKMLPILLFESVWKLLWLGAIAVPLWLGDGMDPATSEVAGSVLWVVLIVAVVPWRYAVWQYVARPGDAWRPGRASEPDPADHGGVGQSTS